MDSCDYDMRISYNSVPLSKQIISSISKYNVN